MSMWLPGGAGASIRSGARTTWRTCCATSQTSTTRARPHRLWLVAPIASEPARHEARRGLVTVLRDAPGHLGLHARSRGQAVLDPRVLRGRDGAHRGGRGAGVLVVATDVRPRLGRDHGGHLPPGPHAARVDVEVVEVVAGVGLDAPLLRLQHDLVLEEDAGYALAQPRGDDLLVQAPVAGEGPQVEA